MHPHTYEDEMRYLDVSLEMFQKKTAPYGAVFKKGIFDYWVETFAEASAAASACIAATVFSRI